MSKDGQVQGLMFGGGAQGKGDRGGDNCDVPTPSEQNDEQTPVKTLPSRNFVAGGNYAPGKDQIQEKLNSLIFLPEYLGC